MNSLFKTKKNGYSELSTAKANDHQNGKNQKLKQVLPPKPVEVLPEETESELPVVSTPSKATTGGTIAYSSQKNYGTFNGTPSAFEKGYSTWVGNPQAAPLLPVRMPKV